MALAHKLIVWVSLGRKTGESFLDFVSLESAAPRPRLAPRHQCQQALQRPIAVVAPGEDAKGLGLVSKDQDHDLGARNAAIVEPDLHVDPGSRILARIGRGASGSQEPQHGLAIPRVLRALREYPLQLLRRHARQS